jgi:hypothetical protein
MGMSTSVLNHICTELIVNNFIGANGVSQNIAVRVHSAEQPVQHILHNEATSKRALLTDLARLCTFEQTVHNLACRCTKKALSVHTNEIAGSGQGCAAGEPMQTVRTILESQGRLGHFPDIPDGYCDCNCTSRLK